MAATANWAPGPASRLAALASLLLVQPSLILAAPPPSPAVPLFPAAAAAISAQAVNPVAAFVDRSVGKPRVFILTDIGNEPDDQMSMVRLLVYSNALDIEGLIATTSTWQKDATHPETIRTLVEDYGQVRANLMLHAQGWPEVARLEAAIASGPSRYGMAGLRSGQISAGARKLIAAVDRADPRPLHVSVWGGANTLAEALSEVRRTRSPAALARFVGKLQVISISDQDDAGPWIRRQFPNLSYVVKPSTQDGAEYASATWTGVSGDKFYRNGDGADFTTVTNEWLDANIRQGPMGAHYPKYLFIMEGDTPSYLNLLPNGLESYRNPSWGGWGGRYFYRQPYGETQSLWTQGGDQSSRVTSADTVRGVDGRTYVSDQATIWRWREVYQHDFAARMAWTYKPYAQANHHPAVAIAGHPGDETIEINARLGTPVMLDASSSTDPDGDRLTYSWFHYAEAGVGTAALADVQLAGEGSARVTITPIATCRPQWLPGSDCPSEGVAHVILAVTDNGSPSLTRYRRVILRISK